MDVRKVLTKEKLKAAFDLFDQDKNGFITIDEIKALLDVGKKFDERAWKEVIASADKNKDGQISYDEFETMMKKFSTK